MQPAVRNPQPYDGVLVVSASVLAVAALTCLTLPRPRPLAPQPAT